MKKPKHSPTPWRTDVVSKDNIDIIAYPEDADTFRYVARECTDADAALIIRAVNSHEALVDALRALVKTSSEIVPDYISPHAAPFLRFERSPDVLREALRTIEQARVALALAEKPE